jgi:hypothetical protein
LDGLTVTFRARQGRLAVVATSPSQLGREKIGHRRRIRLGKSITARAVLGLVRAPAR